MRNFALALLLSTSFVGQALAAVTSIKCSGTRWYDPGTLELAFTVDEAGEVRSVNVEEITKITTTQSDEKHIAFNAETAHVRYTLSFGPRTKDTVFSTVEIDSNGQADKKTTKVYIGKCTGGS